MAFHELATNALKHGALSAPTGQVEVTWEVRGRGDNAATIDGCAMTEAGLPERADALQNLRILIVEDEMLVAMMVEYLLTTLGCQIIKAARVAKAVRLAEQEALDGAILDINLAGESVSPVSVVLDRRGIPFVFATGYGSEGVAPEWCDKPT